MYMLFGSLRFVIQTEWKRWYHDETLDDIRVYASGHTIGLQFVGKAQLLVIARNTIN